MARQEIKSITARVYENHCSKDKSVPRDKERLLLWTVDHRCHTDNAIPHEQETVYRVVTHRPCRVYHTLRVQPAMGRRSGRTDGNQDGVVAKQRATL